MDESDLNTHSHKDDSNRHTHPPTQTHTHTHTQSKPTHNMFLASQLAGVTLFVSPHVNITIRAEEDSVGEVLMS